ncbi:hypothetical protein [Gordonia sp. i37]|nr:hypothetical protein [Gordonia sp. i37]
MREAITSTPDGQVLVCLEWHESFAGWACAVEAFNARTGDTERPLET